MIDAYRVGITIQIQNSIFAQLAELTAAFSKINSQIQGVTKTINSSTNAIGQTTSAVEKLRSAFSGVNGMVSQISSQLKSQALAATTLYMGPRLAETVMKPAFEQESVSVANAMSGLSKEDTERFRARALEVSQKNKDITIAQAMMQMGVMFAVTRNVEGTLASAVDFANASSVMSKDGQPMSEAMFFDMIKFLEMRGAIFNRDGSYNQVKAERNLHFLAQTGVNSHHNVNPSTYLAEAKMAGPEQTMRQSDLSLYGDFAELQMVMGAVRLGTAEMSSNRQIEGHKLTQDQLAEYIANDWVDLTKISIDSHRKVTYKDGWFKYAKQMQEEPDRTQMEITKAAAAKRHISESQVITGVSGRQTTQRMWEAALAIQVQIERYREALEKQVKTQSLEQMAQYKRDNDPTKSVLSFTSAWNDLLASLGKPIMKEVIGYMDSFSATMRNWGNWMDAHPDDMKKIEDFLIQGSVIGVGLIALASGLGLLRTALLAFGVGAAAQVAMENLTGKKGLEALSGTIIALSDAWNSIPQTLRDAMIAFLATTMITRNPELGALSGVTSLITGGIVDGANYLRPTFVNGINDLRNAFGLPPMGSPPVKSREEEHKDLAEKERMRNLLPFGANGRPREHDEDPKNNTLSSLTSGTNATPMSTEDIISNLARMGDGKTNSSVKPPGKQSFAPSNTSPVQVVSHTTLHLDGNVVAQSVNRSNVQQAKLPLSTTSSFDGSRNANFPGSPMFG